MEDITRRDNGDVTESCETTVEIIEKDKEVANDIKN